MESPAVKTLLLMRHAKSDHHVGLPDHDRPLNDRGKRDAPAMGWRMKEEEIQPDWIVSSTAARAKATAQLFAEANGYYPDIVYERKLYMAGVEEYLEVIHGLPEEAACVLIVSHNPGTEQMVDYLGGVRREMPTAAICVLEYDVSRWVELSKGKLAEAPLFFTPKD
jgi:phosphohistidine phosphatase